MGLDGGGLGEAGFWVGEGRGDAVGGTAVSDGTGDGTCVGGMAVGVAVGCTETASLG